MLCKKSSFLQMNFEWFVLRRPTLKKYTRKIHSVKYTNAAEDICKARAPASSLDIYSILRFLPPFARINLYQETILLFSLVISKQRNSGDTNFDQVIFYTGKSHVTAKWTPLIVETELCVRNDRTCTEIDAKQLEQTVRY